MAQKLSPILGIMLHQRTTLNPYFSATKLNGTVTKKSAQHINTLLWLGNGNNTHTTDNECRLHYTLQPSKLSLNLIDLAQLLRY